MDLWIRSQDKTVLTKANSLWVSDNQIWMEVPFYENHKKIGLTVAGHNHRLAFYKSKERALEVLNEIQTFLIIDDSDFDKEGVCGIYHNVVASKQVVIYEMPKE